MCLRLAVTYFVPEQSFAWAQSRLKRLNNLKAEGHNVTLAISPRVYLFGEGYGVLTVRISTMRIYNTVTFQNLQINYD